MQQNEPITTHPKWGVYHNSEMVCGYEAKEEAEAAARRMCDIYSCLEVREVDKFLENS